ASGVTLSAGTGTLLVQSIDTAGNTTAGTGHSYNLETIGPTIAITSPIAGDNTINAAEAAAGITISGTTTGAESGQTITVKIVDGSHQTVDSYTATAGSGSWSVSVTQAQAQALADGTYTVTADVSDAAGNPALEATQSITVAENARVDTWTGNTSNNWSDSGNWNPRVPVPGDQA